MKIEKIAKNHFDIKNDDSRILLKYTNKRLEIPQSESVQVGLA